jgi:hypothetical protein
MAFPVSIQGAPGMEKGMTSGAKHRLGTRMQLPDGRVFYYGLCAEAITAGKVAMMGATDHADHIKDLAIPAAYAAGVSQITITNSGLAVTGTGKYTGDYSTAGTYENGYVFVNDEDGQGQVWQIMDHSTAGASATITVDFYPNDSVRTALTTSSQVGLAKSIYAEIEVFDLSDIDGPVVGVPNCDQTSGYYGWYQTAGPAAVLTNGTVVVGKNVMTGSTTDGSVDVMADDSSAEFLIGGVINVAATTEYSLVDLQIRY